MTRADFLDAMKRLRFIDRDCLPDTDDWDVDWPIFRDDPFCYFIRCSERHQDDIWSAVLRDRAGTQMQHTARMLKQLADIFNQRLEEGER